MTEVAKEKETGALNESAESIKVMLWFDFVLYWLIDQGKEEGSVERGCDGNLGETLVRLCDALIDWW